VSEVRGESSEQRQEVRGKAIEVREVREVRGKRGERRERREVRTER
jgi:hypothetical protein